jgi:hypothetical protein
MFKRKVSRLKFRAAVVVGAFLFQGCATTSNELKIGKLTPKQRIYVGRVLVNFGGLPRTDLKCEAYINSDIVPAFKIAPDGYFFYKTDRTEPRLSKLTCYHRESLYLAAWHHQKLGLKPFFRSEEQKEAVYFGDIIIDWNFNKAETAVAAQREPYTSNPPREGHVYESGEIKVEVKSDFALMNRLFFEKVEGAQEAGFVLKEHLVAKEK